MSDRPSQPSAPDRAKERRRRSDGGPARLAQFSLLADPDTIAGIPSDPKTTEAHEHDEATGKIGSRTRPSLDAAAARALSNEARRRSDSSRAELLAARREFDGIQASQWRTHPLQTRADTGDAGNAKITERVCATAEVAEEPFSSPNDAEKRTDPTAELVVRVDALERLLAQRDAQLEERFSAIEALRERLDAQTDALERTRGALEEERRHNTAQRRLLPPETDDGRTEGIQEPLIAPDSTRESEPSGVHSAFLPAIYDAWLDDQIRRHFGPLGIDCLADLVRQGLERNQDLGRRELQIAWMANSDLAGAVSLADELLRHLAAPFRLHVIDQTHSGAMQRQVLGPDHPLRPFIEVSASIDTPEALDSLFSEKRPDLVISRHFLSEQTDSSRWIEVLEKHWSKENELILVERTGLGTEAPSESLIEAGERIWQLMPERYTRISDGEGRLRHWAEAFATTGPAREGGVLRTLRDRFSFDLTAQFGFLADAFVATGVGANFSAEIPKDRRFLSQIADLDDRRIEAGAAPALHGVARILGRGASAE